MTVQCAESLEFQGRKYLIAEQPLRSWLSENAQHIRFNHIDVSKYLPKRKDKNLARNQRNAPGNTNALRFRTVNPLQGAFPFSFKHTACYRGYQGTWALDGDRLFLTRIDGTLVDGQAATLAVLFPEHPEPVFAHWFSGEIHGDVGQEFVDRFDVTLHFESGLLIKQEGPSTADTSTAAVSSVGTQGTQENPVGAAPSTLAPSKATQKENS